jgi:hypothetical protein
MTGSLAFATWSGLAVGGPDDLLAAKEVAQDGRTVTAAVWDDPKVDWASFDAIVIRSTWDYFRRRPAFLDWVRSCSRLTRLWNVETTVVWNSHKSYLFDLAAQGIPIIPTERARTGESLEELCRRREWGDVVVKPMVSAAADSTYYIPVDGRADFEPSFATAVDTAEQMVQPFLPGVLSPGEHSLVYVAGQFMHAFAKGPALPIDRRDLDGIKVVAATPQELDVGERTLTCIRPTPLYARVDLVPGLDGRPTLMELELIEPYLHFAASETCRRTFASALIGRM